MRFMDEVHIGDRCEVTTKPYGRGYCGTVVAKDEGLGKVGVQYDDGGTFYVALADVMVTEPDE